MSAKTAGAKLESELKQEKGNALDIRKLLAEERNVMSTMDMEHQQQLVDLEQRHQEKVVKHVSVNYMLIYNLFTVIHIYEKWFLLPGCRCFTSLTSYKTNPYMKSPMKQSRRMRRVQRRRSFSNASKFRFVSTDSEHDSASLLVFAVFSQS